MMIVASLWFHRYNINCCCCFTDCSANVAINGSKFFVISESIPEVTPEVPDDVVDTSSCGQTKLCMRDPAGCEGGSCDWVMTSRDVGVAYDIELSATVTQLNAWAAFGLSHDYGMVSQCAIVGQ